MLMKYIADQAGLNPKYNGPVYSVRPAVILAHAASLYEAYDGPGTYANTVIRVVSEIDPLELLILSMVWDSNLWSDSSKVVESRKLSKTQTKIYEKGPALALDQSLGKSIFQNPTMSVDTLWWFKSAAEFSSFPKATPIWDPGESKRIVSYFPSATRPSFLLDMIWELENDVMDKKKFAKELRAKYAALLNEEKYPKKFFTINSITGKTIINTNDKSLYGKYFGSDSNHFFLSSIAQIYINELDGYIATDEWND